MPALHHATPPNKPAGNQATATPRPDPLPTWLAAGVPLPLKIGPARPHGWLIDAPERQLLETWLEAVSESSTPAHPGG